MKANKKKRLTSFGWFLFYLYIILLSYFLFFSEHFGRDYVADEFRYNLVFFKEIKRFIVYRKLLGTENFVVNILGNILAFAPFGFMLPLLSKRYRGFFRILFTTIFFSLSIEAVQLVLKVGIFDVDDIMMNTLGGVIGYFLYVIVHAIYRKLSRKKTIL